MRYFLLIALIVLFAVLSISQVKDTSLREYRIGTINWVGWSFLQVAEEKGYWSDLNLRVKVIHFPEGVLIHDAMRVGDIDFSMAMAGMLIDKDNDSRAITVLATTDWSHGGDKILVRDKLELGKNEGATVGFYVNGPSLKYFFNLYLKSINMDITRFNLVVMYPDELAAQFRAGRLQAAIMYDPYALEMEKEFPGIKKADTADFPGCIREIIYTFKDVIKDIPDEDLVKLCRGIVRANRWINDPANDKEYLKILNNKTFRGWDPFSDSEIQQMLDDVRIHSPEFLLEENRSGGAFEKHLKKMFEFMFSVGDLERVPEVDEYFDNKYILQALKLEGTF